MNDTNCLSEQDLVLHYYQELPADGERVRHLVKCQACQERLSVIVADLAALPSLGFDTDPAAGTRMAARVSEQLQQRRRIWMPALGAAAVAAFALVLTFSLSFQKQEQAQVVQLATSPAAIMNLDEDMPDIDFLEDLELLEELDLIRQIEGV